MKRWRQRARKSRPKSIPCALSTLHCPIQLEVDPVRITQVITNLLTNAAKYTPPGGAIQLGTRLDAQDLVILVRDNGVGLTAEQTATMFDMFTRVDSELGRDRRRTGHRPCAGKGIRGTARRPHRSPEAPARIRAANS